MTETAHTPLPCPFCGCPFVRVSVPVDPRFKRSVNCPSCHSHGGWGNDDAEALTAWNTRAVNSHHDLIEALRALELANDRVCGARPQRVYDAMIAAGMSDALLALDEARRAARAILTKAEAGHG